VEGLLGLSQQIEHIGDQDPRPVAYATRDYTTLSNYLMDPQSSEYQIRQIQIDEAQKVLKEARALQANILYTLAHPRDFKRFDRTSLEKKLTYLDDKIIGLKIEIAKLMSFQHTPDPEALRVDLSADLPSMRRFAGKDPLQVSCEIKPHSTCGVATYQVKESSACGAIAPKEGTGPVCGVTFKFAPHPACGIKSFNKGTGAICGVKRWDSCHKCGKQRWPGGPNDKRACPKCGPAEFNSCQDKSFGPLEFNSCRTPENGVESYGTCRDKSFGYDFASCRHFTHGVESYRSCEVSVIGDRESACPKF